MNDIDKSQLIAAVATRLKVRLDENDPAFLLVELNRMILDQAVRDVLEESRRHISRIAREAPDPAWAEHFARLVAKHLAATPGPAQGPAPPAPVWPTIFALAVTAFASGCLAGLVSVRGIP
jgi:hypothetical protein